MTGIGRLRRIAVWAALAAALAAAIGFVIVRAAVPSDGGRIAFYDQAWARDGVTLSPIDAPAAGLEARDVVTAVGGRTLEAWLADAGDPTTRRPDPSSAIDYALIRDGAPLDVTVTWAPPSLGATLLEGWSFVVLSMAFAGIAAFVLHRRPDAPAAVPLALMAVGAAGSSVPWFLGTTVSDVVHGAPFLLYALVTGPLYMVMWPATLHFALVFPAPLPFVARRPGIVPLVYAAGLGGWAAALAAGRLTSPTTLEWVGTWPLAQIVVVVPMLALALAAFVYTYVRAADAAARARMRWAALGAVVSAVVGLVAFWIPELLFQRQLLDPSWMGVVALPFPLGLAAGILRDRLFDIDVVVNRTLVYGGLTLGVLASYAIVASALGSLVGPEHGYGVTLLATGAAALIALPLRDVLQRTVNRLMYGERDEPWRAVRRLGRRLEWTAERDRALPAIAETIADTLRLPYAAIELDAAGANRTAHGTAAGPTIMLPVVHGGEPLGRLVLGVRAGERGFRADELALLEDLARQAGGAIHALLLREDLVRSREALVLAREEERRRLRRDLHDGLGPSLAAIGLRAEASAATLATDPAGAMRLLEELGDDVRAALADIRRLVDGLRPPALDELGLLGAIEHQVRRLEAVGTGPSLRVEGSPAPLPELPAAVEVAAYRIAVEAVTNAVRHAGASTCRVRLSAGAGAADGSVAGDADAVEDTLTIDVVDDGRGVAPDAVAGVGLESSRARAEELGGSWRLERPPGGGTRVVAVLPLVPHGVTGDGRQADADLMAGIGA